MVSAGVGLTSEAGFSHPKMQEATRTALASQRERGMVDLRGVPERSCMPSFRIALLVTSAWTPLAIADSAPPRMGEPLAGLTASELVRFDLGRVQYERNFSAEDGLGPVRVLLARGFERRRDEGRTAEDDPYILPTVPAKWRCGGGGEGRRQHRFLLWQHLPNMGSTAPPGPSSSGSSSGCT